MSHAERRVLVVGGGLAGMAAAATLADHGRRVTLLERRPFLGGRAYSFRDSATGAVIDNGQHVLVGACTRLRAFLDRIGSSGAFRRQPRLHLPVLDGTGRQAAIAAPPLPAPLHLVAAVLRYRHLDLSAKRAVERAVRALVRERDSLNDDLSLGDWLAQRGSPPVAIDRFWELLVRPALNVPVAEANLPLAAFLVARAFWSGRREGALCLPAHGLSGAIGRPALATLTRAGVAVRLGARVARIETDGRRVEGVCLADGSRLPAEAVICAVPPRALDTLVRGACREAPYDTLGSSAIVNVYLWYDRPILPVALAGTFDSPLQWVFDRARLLGIEAAGGECVGVSLSAADRYLEWSKEQLAEHCDEALARLLPVRRRARLLRHAVVKDPRATFRAGPGLAGRRPGTGTSIEGLWLAGDWTDTGWPATMEGAVRSGEAAARRVLAGRPSADRALSRT